MNADFLLAQRLICIVTMERLEDAQPLAEALLSGGLNVMEITFRTAAAVECIARIRKNVPGMTIGAGTLLTREDVKKAVDGGAQFGVSPGLSESVLAAAGKRNLPMFPGVVTPSEVTRALELDCKRLKFFPAEAAGGVATLEALAGPFSHTGVKFIPTGSIGAERFEKYLAAPLVAAVGGSWMATRKLISEKAWDKITALTAEAMSAIARLRKE